VETIGLVLVLAGCDPLTVRFGFVQIKEGLGSNYFPVQK
jgi:hypothetical protein